MIISLILISFFVFVYIASRLLDDFIASLHEQAKANKQTQEHRIYVVMPSAIVQQQATLDVVVNDQLLLPRRAYDSAGYDLFCAHNTTIAPNVPCSISTGVRLAIPKGYVGFIKERSSMSAKGYTIHAGVIDSDYRGFVSVLLSHKTPHTIEKYEKIAQLVILPIFTGEVRVVSRLGTTQRGRNGFGSSNVSSYQVQPSPDCITLE